MEITVNGKARSLAAPTPLVEFLTQHGIERRAIAVQHNGEILRRPEYEAVTLREGDVLEIVHVVGGG
jgi:thiamine biosynthesis protein ThiS